MPQQDMSSKIGKSSSPVMQRVIDNNKNVQQPVSGPKHPQPVPVKK